ncbi:MAG: class I SAM-dependent DNA methyltransferase [Polyangiaceae bacterium]|nr:class I SAM-dependent DNA methyltransferase [Polyangiaceae bacterium]
MRHFGEDGVAATRTAASRMTSLFHQLVARGEERGPAQRFVLQCAVRLFAQELGLHPRGLFTRLLDDCLAGTRSPGELGGVALRREEVRLLRAAALEIDWAKVQPAVFGALFQASMDRDERHALGAHFTSEADIQRVILPTIVRPFRERVQAARTTRDLLAARDALRTYRVLDPACGSGDFLHVAYREMVRLDVEIAQRLRRPGGEAGGAPSVSLRQFFGIDINPFAVELAKVVLIIAARLARAEATAALGEQRPGAEPAPPDDPGDNLRCDDALFCDWPEADAIIGNPPYQSKNRMQRELGAGYVQRLRRRFVDVPGRADYCVYWFRRAHDALPPGGRAGLVGTNTIRQNYSREGGLDYIIGHGGTITEAVSSQVWSGEAAVHVSIVSWVKGRDRRPKLLSWQNGDSRDSPWEQVSVPEINAALSPRLDVTSAFAIAANRASGGCYQGQTHGHVGFLLDAAGARAMVARDRRSREVLFPLLIGADLLGREDRSPSRWAIDFHPRDLRAASSSKAAFAHVESKVLPDRLEAAEAEALRNAAALRADPEARVNRHHACFLERWWLFSWPRPELIRVLAGLKRYAVCVRTTKRPIFDFVSSTIRPNDALQVFALEDDYSFGILQSSLHWQWFVERSSTLKRDHRYTSDTVFDSFAWPQQPGAGAVRAVASAAVALRRTRARLMSANRLTLRALYRELEAPGRSALRDAHEALDSAVRTAYGMEPAEDALSFLLELNRALHAAEIRGEPVVGPGLPPSAAGMADLVTEDCVPAPAL